MVACTEWWCSCWKLDQAKKRKNRATTSTTYKNNSVQIKQKKSLEYNTRPCVCLYFSCGFYFIFLGYLFSCVFPSNSANSVWAAVWVFVGCQESHIFHSFFPCFAVVDILLSSMALNVRHTSIKCIRMDVWILCMYRFMVYKALATKPPQHLKYDNHWLNFLCGKAER